MINSDEDFSNVLKKAKENAHLKEKIKSAGVSEEELKQVIFWIRSEKHKNNHNTATPSEYIDYTTQKLKDHYKNILT